MTLSRYRKIGKKHPDYQRVRLQKYAGLDVCDAVTHNSPKGCKNPKCFNFRSTK